MSPSNDAQNGRLATGWRCPVIELRQYTLHPGGRDVLIELFEREFVESQEALGISIIGRFCDLDDPERFVWLRGFGGMDARAAALAAFYGGLEWDAHREAANATMLDSDNVLLLRPMGPRDSVPLGRDDSDVLRRQKAQAIVVATIHYLDAGAAEGFATFFEAVMIPRLAVAGGLILAVLATEDSPNTFPELPVREGENVFLWFTVFPDLDGVERHRSVLRQAGGWRESASAEVIRQLMRKPEVLILKPTFES